MEVSVFSLMKGDNLVIGISSVYSYNTNLRKRVLLKSVSIHWGFRV